MVFVDAGLILALVVALAMAWRGRQRMARRRLAQAPASDNRDAIVAYLRSHFDG
jgi:hypothetical protein